MSNVSYTNVLQQIRELVETAFVPIYLQIKDESHKHSGHRGAQEHGGGHLEIIMASEKFSNLSTIERHRQVYALLQPFMKDQIHALALKTYSPLEWEKNRKLFLDKV